MKDSDQELSPNEMAIDAEHHRYPYCIVWTPIPLMPEHQETAASLWRQLAGGSYLWWALAVIVVAGTVSARATEWSVSPRPLPASAPAA